MEWETRSAVTAGGTRTRRHGRKEARFSSTAPRRLEKGREATEEETRKRVPGPNTGSEMVRVNHPMEALFGGVEEGKSALLSMFFSIWSWVTQPQLPIALRL